MIPTIEVINALTPDDVLVVRYEGPINQDAAKRVREAIGKAFKCHLLVLGGGPSLTVVRRPKRATR